MNSNIDKLIKLLQSHDDNKNKNGKRSRDKNDEINKDEIINDFRIMAIDILLNLFDNNIPLGRKLTKSLNSIEKTFNAFALLFTNNKQNDLQSLVCIVMCEYVVELTKITKIESYHQGRKFDFIKYLLKERKNLEKNTHRNKRLKVSFENNLALLLDNNDLDNINKFNTDNIDDEEYDDEYYNKFDNYIIYSADKKKPKDKKSNKNGHKFMDELEKVESKWDNPKEEALEYFCNLSKKKSQVILKALKNINNKYKMSEPELLKLINMDIPIDNKNYIIKQFLSVSKSCSSNTKLKSWLDNVMKIPFGKYKGTDLKSMKPQNIKVFLDKLQHTMDDAVWGHKKAKRTIIQLMGQEIRNPGSKGGVLGIWGPPGNGKCFAYDTPILMYDGTIKKVQDIIIGDKIMGDNSRPRNILSLGSGKDDMFEIVSNIGDSYVVNSEHILCLKTDELNKVYKKDNKFVCQYFNKKLLKLCSTIFDSYNEAQNNLVKLLEEYNNILEITVNDYNKLDRFIKNKLKGYKVPVDFEYKNIDTKIKPYAYGKTENIESIPNYYKINSRNIRLDLLAGLIDSRADFNIKSQIYTFNINNSKLISDIIFLSRSLGFTCYIQNNNGNKNILLYGNGLEDIPVRCENKQYFMSCSQNNLLYDIEVNHIGYDNYYGFMIDGNERFILGNFTVTHNTTLIKEGIAKAMNRPFVFISLGGASDGSFLEGHSYTYEGSIYGRIVRGLIETQCMNPIIYFDELDKISKSRKGDEITNLLVHLIDPVQNCHFTDKYFHGLNFDLSRVTFIFSFNDCRNINYILLDRITRVETKYLLISQKILIAQKYLLPGIFKEMGLEKGAINFTNKQIENIINKYTFEGGVRKLKSILFSIIRELNISQMTQQKLDNKIVSFPFKLKDEHCDKYLQEFNKIKPDKIHHNSKVGVVNGMWAGSLGVGGILPIETMLIPGKGFLDIKATGSLEKVIKESIHVACSLAWSKLDRLNKNRWFKKWKKNPEGFHIHCPEGAVSKDGPSAGTALTLAIYSLLTGKKINNTIAITGEINLQGKVLPIGGLEEKLQGAKKAGIKLALIPKDNKVHLDKVKIRNDKLLDDTFKVEFIEYFDEVLPFCLSE